MVARFDELAAWQRCVDLCDAVCEHTDDLSDRHFADQIRKAVRSAPALIAEGFARYTTREFVRYLRMARGELAEVQSDLHIGRRRNYFTAETFESLNTLARRAMGTTTNLLKAKLRQLDDPDAP